MRFLIKHSVSRPVVTSAAEEFSRVLSPKSCSSNLVSSDVNRISRSGPIEEFIGDAGPEGVYTEPGRDQPLTRRLRERADIDLVGTGISGPLTLIPGNKMDVIRTISTEIAL